jgi:hypothetical protein
MILLLTPEQALANWTIIAPMLSRARDTGQGESTITDYMQKILNRHAQCWAIMEGDSIIGVGLTEILTYSQHRTLHIILFTGSSFEDQAAMFPVVERFAKDQGCIAVEQWGRAGWAKVLPKYVPGFKQAYVVMRKTIGEDT